MTAQEAGAKAESYFKSGFNCAQSVLCVFASQLGIDEDTAKKIAQPFGGGVCRMREVCGTFSGIMMALGLAKGSSDSQKESKDSIYSEGQKIALQFKKDNGSIICKELLNLQKENAVKQDAFNPVSEERTQTYYQKRPCSKLCFYAAELFQNYLDGKL